MESNENITCIPSCNKLDKLLKESKSKPIEIINITIITTRVQYYGDFAHCPINQLLHCF